MPRRDLPVVFGLLLIVGVMVVRVLGRAYIPLRVAWSLDLVVIFIGGFLLLVLLIPAGQDHSWLAMALFFGLIGLYKLLGRFESAVEK